jgi:hypothetical protein
VHSWRISLPRTIRARLLTFFLIFSLVPLLAVGGAVYEVSQQALRAQAASELDQVANLQARSFEQWMAGHIADVSLMAASEGVQSLERERIMAYALAMKDRQGVYEGIDINDARGIAAMVMPSVSSAASCSWAR